MSRQKVFMSAAKDVDMLNHQLNTATIKLTDKLDGGKTKNVPMRSLSGFTARCVHITVYENEEIVCDEDFAVGVARHCLDRIRQRLRDNAVYVNEDVVLSDVMALLRRNRVFETLFCDVRCGYEAILIDADRRIAYAIYSSEARVFYVRTFLSIDDAIEAHGCLSVNADDKIIVTGAKGYFSLEAPPYIRIKS